jgi:two-component system phosphate regulon sensor histidine kinase PhoR
LCAIAVLALIVAGFYADEPLRSVLFVMCGCVAGAAVVLAWPRHATQINADQNTSNRMSSRTMLSATDLVAAMPDPAIVLSRTTGVMSFNDAARAVFERLSQGQALEHLNRDPEFIAAVVDVFETGEKRTAKLTSPHRRGQRLLATVTPLGGSGERPVIAVLITVHDESEQHRLLEMRTDFIANASHELRTPLASVRGFIETLQGPARNDEAARSRFLAIMAEQAERMTRLIDDLLLLSRVEEKANLNPTGEVDLDALLKDVVRAMTPAAAARDMTISIAATTPHLLAKGDRDELFQVFHNLIENAVKYGRDGGSVKVQIAEAGATRPGNAGRRICVTISDDGPGIAPEHLPRLTERFYRVSTEHSRRIGGTGLGLAIVKHVLNRHEGEMSVESVLGSGTTFRVTLPVKKITQ